MRRTIAAVALVFALSSATPVFATIVNVGGGTWNYGTSYSFPFTKNVWSHYVHPTKYHSATAICSSNNVKVFNIAAYWANADTTCGLTDSAAEYWNTY